MSFDVRGWGGDWWCLPFSGTYGGSGVPSFETSSKLVGGVCVAVSLLFREDMTPGVNPGKTSWGREDGRLRTQCSDEQRQVLLEAC
jgi:hypothetical protein